MQMGCLREAAVAGAADRFALTDVFADLDVDLAQVGEYRRETIVVHDLDHLAHAAPGIVAGIFDDAVGGRGDLSAYAGTHIDATVQTSALGDWMFAHPETAGDGGLLQRIAAGNRAEHQVFFEGGMARDRYPFGHR